MIVISRGPGRRSVPAGWSNAKAIRRRLLAQRAPSCKSEGTMTANRDWSGSSGDLWARRWRDTDRALREVGAALDSAVLDAAPNGPLAALDVGCGPGTTALALAAARPDASVLGCDLSQALVALARDRAAGIRNVQFVAGDAEQVAREHGPFDLIYSRHGVMFFDDPVRAFATLRNAATGGGRLVFSCFQDWELNPWASEFAAAAAGEAIEAPGREPGPFAFADPQHVRRILASAGWMQAEPRALSFTYVAGEGGSAVDDALSFMVELGPASRLLESRPLGEREAGIERMRQLISSHERGGRVAFPAAAWIWSARAG
jgi:SAM-dependent methyltransferase